MSAGWTASSATCPGTCGRPTGSTTSTGAAAKLAIQAPARERGVEFADDAATELVARLGKVLVRDPATTPEEVDAPYVQPFQLQVVCRRLWKAVARERGDEFKAIELRT